MLLWKTVYRLISPGCCRRRWIRQWWERTRNGSKPRHRHSCSVLGAKISSTDGEVSFISSAVKADPAKFCFPQIWEEDIRIPPKFDYNSIMHLLNLIPRKLGWAAQGQTSCPSVAQSNLREIKSHITQYKTLSSSKTMKVLSFLGLLNFYKFSFFPGS